MNQDNSYISQETDMNRPLFGAISALALTAGTAAFAEAEHTLVISSWVPPTHNINTQMLPR